MIFFRPFNFSHKHVQTQVSHSHLNYDPRKACPFPPSLDSLASCSQLCSLPLVPFFSKNASLDPGLSHTCPFSHLILITRHSRHSVYVSQCIANVVSRVYATAIVASQNSTIMCNLVFTFH